MTAAQARTAEDVQAFAERAVAPIHDVGKDQAFVDFSRPDGGFIEGELYIFRNYIPNEGEIQWYPFGGSNMRRYKYYDGLF